MKSNRELAKEVIDLPCGNPGMIARITALLDHKDKQAAILVEGFERIYCLPDSDYIQITKDGDGEIWINVRRVWLLIEEALAKYKEGMKEDGK